MDLTLYGYWRSSSSYRVRIALELKGLAYTYAPVHLLEGGGQQFSEDYRAKNPSAQVPTLVVSGDGEPFVIAQSVAILEFLDETFPAPALLPTAPRDRARVRQLVEVINSGIQPIANLSVLKHLGRAMQQDEVARNIWTRHWIATGFEALEMLLAKSAGRFAFGDEVTLADCFIVPQVYNANRFQVDLGPYPILRRVSEEAEALPAFLRARPEVQVDAPVQT
jgi:maleylacetoacetate isomerase